MMDNAPQNKSANDPETQPNSLIIGQPTAVQIKSGMCHVLFAHDVGLSIDLNEAERRITATKQRETIKRKRRAPQYFEYSPPPLRVTVDILPFTLSDFHTFPSVDLMVYDFGAISVTYSIPLSGPLSQLMSLSDELYDNMPLLADSRRRVEDLLKTIGPAINKPAISDIVEDYAVYQVETWQPVRGLDQILSDNGPMIAQILRAELNPLSQQQVQDALACRISFAQDDLLIVDWNAAMLFDSGADDVRTVLEYANVELLEMRYLDDRLDDALDEAYLALTQRAWGKRLRFSAQTSDLRRIAELQVDSALMFEGVNNALKLLGDQYLARVYQSASQRLHVNDWDANIIRKLHTLESIYQKMTDHHSHWRMEILEWIIIILIAVSIAVSLLPGITGH